MKALVEKEFGGDGAKAGLYVGDGQLKLEVNYPLDKLVSPLYTAVDKGIDSAEAAIPGDWDKAILEPIRAAIKAQIASLLAGV